MTSRRQILLYAFSFAAAATHAQSQTRNRTVIALTDLEKMFSNMRSQTKWNVDGNLLWGYFFFDPHPEKLKTVAGALQSAGYRVVNLYPSDDKTTYVLHVEKIETHTPHSLHKRNQELEALAERYGIETYDGMDVGPVSGAKN